MRPHGKSPNEPIDELLETTRKRLKLRESNYKKLKRLQKKKHYTFARIIRLAILEGIRKFQQEDLFLEFKTQEFEILISFLEERTKRETKETKGKNAKSNHE